MFRRRQPPPEITNDSYSRWIRAQRPPLQWFLEQPELVQEQMALIGDEYVGAVAAEVSIALRGEGPGGDASAEPSLQRAVEAVATRMQARRAPVPNGAPEGPPPSMAGLGARGSKEGQVERKKGRRLFGRAPDQEREESTA